MKKIYAIIIGILSLVALVWVIQLSLEGKPVVKIKLSEFQSTKELSQSILMRLRQEIKDHSILFLGVDPEEPLHLEVWRELLMMDQEPGWKIDEIFVEKGLILPKPLGLGENIIDVKEFESHFKTTWFSESYKNKRVAVIVPNIYSSQLIKDNPAQRLKSNPNESRILSLSLVPLSDNTESPEVNRIPCAADGADYTGQSPLGCMIRKKAMFWKRKFAPKKNGSYLGIVEQVGLHDYLIYFRSHK